MTRYMTKSTWTLILLAATFPASAVLAVRAANAADQDKGAAAPQANMPQPVAYEEEVATAPVTVENIDKKARTIVVRTPDGDHTTVKVPDDVQGFDRLKKGDRINLTFYRAVAVAVVPAGSGASAARPTSDMHPTAATRAGGQQHAGSATVTSVNRQNGTVQVKDQNGKPQTISPQNASVQKDMNTLKPGDVVQIVYTEAVATSLEPAPK